MYSSRGAIAAAALLGLALCHSGVDWGAAGRVKGPRSASPEKRAKRKMAETSRKRNRR